MKVKPPWLIIGVIVCGLIADRPPLHAQAPSPAVSAPSTTGGANEPWNRGVSEEVREAARAVFLEGNRLFKIPLFAQAVEKYTEALGKWRHPAFYFNLALAQLNLGQEVEARENLEHALRYGEAPLGADQFKEARKQLEEVERQLGRIRVTCQTKGAEVTLDGAPLLTCPGNHLRWVKAKDYELTAKKAGYLSESRRVTVASGALQEIELKLITLSEATDTSRRWSVWKPWAVVAAGGAIAAAGGALHALASRNFNTYDERFLQLPCVTMPDPVTPGCSEAAIGPELGAQLSRARRQQSIAVGGYIAGGSLIAAGVVLLYMNRPRLAEEATRTVAVAPAVSSDMLGILVSVSH